MELFTVLLTIELWTTGKENQIENDNYNDWWNGLNRTWISLAKVTNIKRIENDRSWKLIFIHDYCLDK